jgi:hypothetical protein
MHSKKSTSLGLLLIVLVGSVEGTYAQIDKPVNLAFEKQLSGWLKETNVPAAGIAIIENGKLTNCERVIQHPHRRIQSFKSLPSRSPSSRFSR